MAKTNHTLLKFLELPDYLTLLGGVFGILGALAAVDHRFSLAAAFLLCSVPCDYFDGKIARAIHRRTPEFGKALDTIVDTISFGVCPVVFGYCLGLESVVHIVILLIFSGSAALRLARFTVIPPDPEAFTGMPVTYNNLIFPITYLLFHLLNLEVLLTGALTILYLLAAFLMTSTIRWKKF
jgi:CDP-diacylglycerol--serine O-phosphatidyltransferase